MDPLVFPLDICHAYMSALLPSDGHRRHLFVWVYLVTESLFSTDAWLLPEDLGLPLEAQLVNQLT